MAAQPDPVLALQYTQKGLEYYIAGRHAYFHKLHLITDTLCHHAIELLLKAELLNHYSEADLAKRFGHNLQRLWRAFNELDKNQALSQFDSAIQRLDRFEDIRYPGWPHGKSVVVAHGPSKKTSITSQGGSPSDKYVFRLEEVDELVKVIVGVLNINPDFIRGDFERWQSLDIYQRENSHLLW